MEVYCCPILPYCEASITRSSWNTPCDLFLGISNYNWYTRSIANWSDLQKYHVLMGSLWIPFEIGFIRRDHWSLEESNEVGKEKKVAVNWEKLLQFPIDLYWKIVSRYCSNIIRWKINFCTWQSAIFYHADRDHDGENQLASQCAPVLYRILTIIIYYATISLTNS